MSGTLRDKVIVIVGGTAGMGLSGARACAREGARLVVVGREEPVARAAERELAGAGVAIAGDATKSGVAQEAIDRAVREWGRVDGVYHVAGGSGRRMGDGPLHEITDEGWDYTVRLNQTSMFYTARAAVRQFLRQGGGGSVLVMGSILGESPSPAFFATHAYAAAKSAVIGFVRSCAAYYANDDVRFNAIVPALVETPMSQRAVGDERVMAFVRTKQPLDGGRVGRPEDLDAAVVYFLGEGSRFVTGQVLHVDGGWGVTEGQVPRE